MKDIYRQCAVLSELLGESISAHIRESQAEENENDRKDLA